MFYPLTFKPIFKERIWGGDNLRRLYQKPVPPGQKTGESWEVSDRSGDVSIVSIGQFAGRGLRELLQKFPNEILGSARPNTAGLFPLLAKIIDAEQTLSLQVHPPALKAAALGGEPKTEMWYIAHAAAGAELFVGLKRGVSRGDFQEKVDKGTVAECFHRIPVQPGDVMFLPSGRVHALGAGIVIFEIQQNSDTTYRVFDWNRLDDAGQPRALHVAQSLESIDFEDFEPSLVSTVAEPREGYFVRQLVRDPLFDVDLIEGNVSPIPLEPGHMTLLAVVGGRMSVHCDGLNTFISAGGFCLVPAACAGVTCVPAGGAAFLRVIAGS